MYQNQNKMNKFYLLFFCIFTLACNESKSDEYKTSLKPNVLLIMTDDQGWGDLSVHGNDSIHTPNLDQLCKEGVSFDRFFVSPVCAPTRASLLTGRYHLRTGTSWVTHRKEVMRSSEMTIAEYLKGANYRTGIFGKWHNGEQYPNNPEGQGFDEFLGFTAGHWNNYHDPNLFHNEKPVQKKGYINDIFTDAAIDWINNEESEEPFFCYLPYNTPHSPFQVPAKYFDKYKAMGLSDKNASVYGMCENIDDNVGKILNSLQKNKKLENTIVIFLTDNGPNGNRYNGGMKGIKGSVHEGGMRVPLFIKWGNHFEVGKKIKPITCHMDLLPTILDLCEIPVRSENPTDGKSLVPLILDQAAEWPQRQIYHIQSDGKKVLVNAALRNEQHRFVINRDSSMMLFDMQKDPNQTQNIIDEFPNLKIKYFNDLKTWFEEVTSLGISAPPIPVGYQKEAIIKLPAHEASLLQGSIKFKGKMGWANDYFIDWKTPEDLVQWKIDVAETGTYQVILEYACKKENTGSEIEISVGDKTVVGKILEAHYPDFYHSPDYVKRGEVYERDWKKLNLGKIKLPKGESTISMRALSIPNGSVAEVKALELN